MMDFPTQGAFAKDSVILNKWVYKCKYWGHHSEDDPGLSFPFPSQLPFS